MALIGGRRCRSRKVGRKSRKGTRKGMRRKTARRAYKMGGAQAVFLPGDPKISF